MSSCATRLRTDDGLTVRRPDRRDELCAPIRARLLNRRLPKTSSIPNGEVLFPAETFIDANLFPADARTLPIIARARSCLHIPLEDRLVGRVACNDVKVPGSALDSGQSRRLIDPIWPRKSRRRACAKSKYAVC